MKKQRPLQRTLQTIELEIEFLSDAWDKLDSQGTKTEEQRSIADSIAKLESTRKFIKRLLEISKER